MLLGFFFEDGIECVLSDFSVLFFKDQADLERQVFGYARQVGGERIWRKTTAGVAAG